MGCCWSLGCYCKDPLADGKVAVVTGGNQGIGFYTAKALAKKGWHVFLVSRSREKGEDAAAAEIRRATSNPKVENLVCDLSSLSSVRELANEFLAKELPLHCLINNAGVMACPYQLSADSYELQFAVNHLAHFLLTLLLLDKLKSSAPSRIVNVSSNYHLTSGTIPFELFPDYEGGKRYFSWDAYGYTKLANIMFTYELQRRLRGTGVVATTAHPGVIRSNLWQYHPLALCCICKCPTDGARPLVYAATSPNVTEQSAFMRWLVPRCCCTAHADSSSGSYNSAAGRQLWADSLRWVGLEAGPAALHASGPAEPQDEESALLHDYRPPLASQCCAYLSVCPCCWCCC